MTLIRKPLAMLLACIVALVLAVSFTPSAHAAPAATPPGTPSDAYPYCVASLANDIVMHPTTPAQYCYSSQSVAYSKASAGARVNVMQMYTGEYAETGYELIWSLLPPNGGCDGYGQGMPSGFNDTVTQMYSKQSGCHVLAVYTDASYGGSKYLCNNPSSNTGCIIPGNIVGRISSTYSND